MKQKKIIDAMNYIDDEFIESANKTKKKNFTFKWIAVAACFCVAVGGVFAINLNKKEDNNKLSSPSVIESEKGFYIPKSNFTIPKKGVVADCIPFTSYQGFFYQYFYHNGNLDLTDAYLGEAKNVMEYGHVEGDLNVDFNGSVEGKVYSVKGYSKDFMIAVKSEYYIFYLIKNNGITLENGSDLFEKGLHLKDNIKNVKYQSRYDWNFDKGNIKEVRKNIDELIDAINKAEFKPSIIIPVEHDTDNIYDSAEEFHLFIEKTDGLNIELRCFRGGYVMFSGIDAVVQIDEEILNSIVP